MICLKITPYEKNWVCSIDAEKLDTELAELKIGKNAVSFYQEEIDKYLNKVKELQSIDSTITDEMYWGQLEHLSEKDWYIVTSEFFKK